MIGKDKKSLQVTLKADSLRHLQRMSELSGLSKSQLVEIMINKRWNSYINEEIKNSKTHSFIEDVELNQK